MTNLGSTILLYLLKTIDISQLWIMNTENLGSLKSANIIQLIDPREQGEGVGAVVKRTIGTNSLRNLDPFLMLDLFTVRLPSGFADHPHRGFETVTYMLKGRIGHEDFKGHSGVIGPGDIQWMTAGRGIIHAEVPESKTEDAYGFQLWINLPKSKKMIEPHYQEYTSNQIPIATVGNSSIKVIAGSLYGCEGIVKPTTAVEYFDVHLNPGASLIFKINKGFNSFIYLYEGKGSVNGMAVQAHKAFVFKKSDEETSVTLSSDSVMKLIWLSGKPLDEPVVQYGPFVMNTMQEIQQAMSDYQYNRNGFEGASAWESKIQQKMAEN